MINYLMTFYKLSIIDEKMNFNAKAFDTCIEFLESKKKLEKNFLELERKFSETSDIYTFSRHQAGAPFGEKINYLKSARIDKKNRTLIFSDGKSLEESDIDFKVNNFRVVSKNVYDKIYSAEVNENEYGDVLKYWQDIIKPENDWQMKERERVLDFENKELIKLSKEKDELKQASLKSFDLFKSGMKNYVAHSTGVLSGDPYSDTRFKNAVVEREGMLINEIISDFKKTKLFLEKK